MKLYVRFLIVAAVAVPIAVEARTLGGYFGVELTPLQTVVLTLVGSAAVVAVDEVLSGSGGSGEVKEDNDEEEGSKDPVL